MNLLSTKKTAINLISASLLLVGASAANAATFTCQSCDDSFISGSVSVDDTGIWDWSQVYLNPGKEYTLPTYGSVHSNQDTTSNAFSFKYAGIDPFFGIYAPLKGDVKGTVGLGFVAVNWILGTDFLGAFDFDFTDGRSLFTLDAPSEVPLPAAAFMFAPALLGFAALRRKKQA